MVLGTLDGFDFKVWIGLGIALYGLAYFIIHDVWIRQRIKGIHKLHLSYLEAIKEARKAHHQLSPKEKGTCFGLLLFPRSYYHQVQKRYCMQPKRLN